MFVGYYVCLIDFDIILTLPPHSMLLWAYWHYSFVPLSLFSSFSDKKSMFSGEYDLEDDLDVDIGILDGWFAGLLATFGTGSLNPGMVGTINSCVALVLACWSLRLFRISSFCSLASSEEKLLCAVAIGWGGGVIACCGGGIVTC